MSDNLRDRMLDDHDKHWKEYLTEFFDAAKKGLKDSVITLILYPDGSWGMEIENGKLWSYRDGLRLIANNGIRNCIDQGHKTRDFSIDPEIDAVYIKLELNNKWPSSRKIS